MSHYCKWGLLAHNRASFYEKAQIQHFDRLFGTRESKMSLKKEDEENRNDKLLLEKIC
jgi:hypothetical protein